MNRKADLENIKLLLNGVQWAENVTVAALCVGESWEILGEAREFCLGRFSWMERARRADQHIACGAWVYVNEALRRGCTIKIIYSTIITSPNQ